MDETPYMQGAESITQAEHISPLKTGDNIQAKRVALYAWDGTNWVRASSGPLVTPTALVSFVTTVTTAGTEVNLADNVVSAGVLQAPSTNTGIIYVHNANTVSSTVFGAELQPGQSTGVAIDNTDRIWVDSSVSGDKVAFLGS